MKKTLCIKMRQNVTGVSDAVIEAWKEVWRATYTGSGIEVDFELLEEDETATAQRLLSLVRSEFQDSDTEPRNSNEQP